MTNYFSKSEHLAFYSIIKIWISKDLDVEIFRDNIQHILLSEGMYKENIFMTI